MKKVFFKTVKDLFTKVLIIMDRNKALEHFNFLQEIHTLVNLIPINEMDQEKLN